MTWQTIDNPLFAFESGDLFAKFHFEFTTKRPPDELFHYTTNDSFIEILRSGYMFATERMFFNDPQEFTWGYEQLNTTLGCKECAGYETSFIDHVRNALVDKQNDNLRLFVLSLSANPDLLSQWKAYADNGRGICFGMRGDTLRERSGFGEFVLNGINLDTMPAGFCYCYHLLPVIYEPSEQRAILIAFLAAAWEYWRFLKTKDDVKTEELFRLMVQHRMREVLISLKQPGYRDEEEWRIVARIHKKDENIRFRDGRFGITPFVHLNLSPRSKLPERGLDITSVWVGPNSESIKNPRGLEMLLDHHEVEAQVVFSKVAYRG